MILHHITLSTGSSATHRLDLVDPPALAACRGLLPHGGPVPGSPAFHVEIHAPVFTIFRGRDPLVCCGVGRGADPVWAELVALQRRFLPVACTPPAGDWLAVVLLPALTLTARSDLVWLGDFERCLAAAILSP